MRFAAGLLFVAEVALSGWWRWLATAAACVLLVCVKGEWQKIAIAPVGAGVLLLICAAFAGSIGLAVTAVLLMSPWRRMHEASSLTLVGMGLYFLWFRYFAILPFDQLPGSIAGVLSWLAGGALYVTRTAIVLDGRTISFSLIPISIGLVPPVLTFLQTERTRRTRVEFVCAAFAALVGMLIVIAGMTLAGHVHFFATGAWALVPLGIGWISSLLIRGRPRDRRFAWGLWTVVVVLIGILWTHPAAEEARPLRIAFDEAHGKWETIEGSFTTEGYGRDTIYNYVLLARWLSAKHTVTPLRDHWSTIDGDVLVVKMPTEYYNPTEKQAIDEFVRRGGLLLVLGDHTNLYGTTFIINDLLRPYGFELQTDATVPWDTEHYDYQPAWWQRSRYLRGIERIQFQTSATIKARHPLVFPVLVGDRAAAEDADYSNERFFGDLHPGPEDRHAPVFLAAERRVGSGRILLFGDSTIFSTFSLMAPGNGELFQNFIEQGTTSLSAFRLALIVGAVLLAVAAARGHRVMFALSLVAPLLALCAAGRSPADTRLGRYAGDWVAIDGKHSEFELRFDPRGEHGPGLNDFSTLFAWIGRTDVFPFVESDPYADPTTPAIIINPDKPFTVQMLDRVDQYVKQGGRLLVLDDPHFAVRSTSEPLLQRLGIVLEAARGHDTVYDAGPPQLDANLLALPFEVLRSDRRSIGALRTRHAVPRFIPAGVTPMLVDDKGTVIAGQKRIGNGTVVVFLRSVAFSEFAMGDVWGGQDVDPEKMRLYRLAFDLVALLKRKDGP